jgi:hypothetical protein
MVRNRKMKTNFLREIPHLPEMRKFRHTQAVKLYDEELFLFLNSTQITTLVSPLTFLYRCWKKASQVL